MIRCHISRLKTYPRFEGIAAPLYAAVPRMGDVVHFDGSAGGVVEMVEFHAGDSEPVLWVVPHDDERYSGLDAMRTKLQAVRALMKESLDVRHGAGGRGIYAAELEAIVGKE